MAQPVGLKCIGESNLIFFPKPVPQHIEPKYKSEKISECILFSSQSQLELVIYRDHISFFRDAIAVKRYIVYSEFRVAFIFFSM